mmetsp:Transcript_41447/g.93427  ORF Transcript_41447/g.93427 Transcript_41447/m.93427 type:complete len:100 (+) Transcript_41447:60-359(+)
MGAGGREEYLDHLDLGRFVLLLSTVRLLVLDDGGGLHLEVRLRDVACCENRRDGLALHLFDPVRGNDGAETLVRFIKCQRETVRAEMDRRIQRALRACT